MLLNGRNHPREGSVRQIYMARKDPDRRTQLQSLRSDYDRAFAQLVKETNRLQNLMADVDPAELLEAEARIAEARASYRAHRDTLAFTLMKPVPVHAAAELRSAETCMAACMGSGRDS